MVKLDVIIFGATGFTGRAVAQDAVDMLKGLKWGIAGRNMAKLQNVIKTVGDKAGKDLSATPIIIASLEDQDSLKDMTGQCKVLINCCGPYRFYGEPVVKACLETGTHHLDVSGEPQYLGNLQLKYHDLAKEKDTYIISTCGFDSVPAEMGTVYAERNFPGTVNSVEMFWENSVEYKDRNSRALLQSGTWESLIYSMKNVFELLKIAWQLRPKDYPELKPKLNPWPSKIKNRFLDSYFIPIHAGDRDTVLHSQRLRYEEEKKRPIQFENYIGFKSLIVALLVPLQLFFIFMMSQVGPTRRILLRHPKLFTLGLISSQGPTDATMKAQYFQMTFRTKGWAYSQNQSEEPKLTLWTRVSGYNPFYGLTSVALLTAAKILLKEKHRIPARGGVLTPGFAFDKTSLIDELGKHKYGIKFEVLNLDK